MPKRNHKDWLEAYYKFASHNCESPDLYHRWVGVSVIAAALQRKVYLTWEKEIYPNMYIVLVGPSACRKGTAMYPAKWFLNKLGVALAAECTTREALIVHMSKIGADLDMEGGEVKRHSSLTIFSPEFGVFLKTDQDGKLTTDLTDWYDCGDDWTYRTRKDTKEGQDGLLIAGIFVNLLAATTPGALQDTLPMESISGGLTSRILFVYASRKSKVVPIPKRSDTYEQQQQALLEDLEMIRGLQGEFVVTEEFIKGSKKYIGYEQWYITEDGKIPLAKELEPYYGRRQMHLLKLCMIHSASRGADMTLTLEDFTWARALLEETEALMPMAFENYGRSEFAVLQSPILKFVEQHGTKGVTNAQLVARFIRDFDDPSEMQKPIQMLLQSNKIIVEMVERDGKMAQVYRRVD